MSTPEDIVAAVLDDGTLASLIGARIYPIVLPATPTLPAITYQMVSAPQDPTQDGPGRIEPRYRFKVWSETYTGLQAITDALKALFNLRRESVTRVWTVDGSTEDHDQKTSRWWRIVDILANEPA